MEKQSERYKVVKYLVYHERQSERGQIVEIQHYQIEEVEIQHYQREEVEIQHYQRERVKIQHYQIEGIEIQHYQRESRDLTLLERQSRDSTLLERVEIQQYQRERGSRDSTLLEREEVEIQHYQRKVTSHNSVSPMLHNVLMSTLARPVFSSRNVKNSYTVMGTVMVRRWLLARGHVVLSTLLSSLS